MKRFIFLCAALTAGVNAANAIDAVNGTTYTDANFPSSCDSLVIASDMTITLNGVNRSRTNQCATNIKAPLITIKPSVVCTLNLAGNNTFNFKEKLSAGIQIARTATLVIQGQGSLEIHNTDTTARGASIGGAGGKDGGNGGPGSDGCGTGQCFNYPTDGGAGEAGNAGTSMGTLIVNGSAIYVDRIGGGDGGAGGNGGKGGSSKGGCCCSGHNGGSGGSGGNGGEGGYIQIFGGILSVTDCIRGGHGNTGGSGGAGGGRSCSQSNGNYGSGGSGGNGGACTNVEIYGGNVSVSNGIRMSNRGSGSGSPGSTLNKYIIIKGGNVNIPDTGNYTQPTNPKGGLNDTCYLNIIPLGTSYANKKVKEGAVIDNVRCVTQGTEDAYGIKDVQTDNEGKLYFWFPNRWGEN